MIDYASVLMEMLQSDSQSVSGVELATSVKSAISSDPKCKSVIFILVNNMMASLNELYPGEHEERLHNAGKEIKSAE